MALCEDYPACGHTPDDPCGEQWYDKPGAFDTTIPGNEHALCDHEFGICDVWDEDEPEEWDENDDVDEPFVAEDQFLDSYMEDRLTTMFEG